MSHIGKKNYLLRLEGISRENTSKYSNQQVFGKQAKKKTIIEKSGRRRKLDFEVDF